MPETRNPGPLSGVVPTPEEDVLFPPEFCKESVDRAMAAVRKPNEQEVAEDTTNEKQT